MQNPVPTRIFLDPVVRSRDLSQWNGQIPWDSDVIIGSVMNKFEDPLKKFSKYHWLWTNTEIWCNINWKHHADIPITSLSGTEFSWKICFQYYLMQASLLFQQIQQPLVSYQMIYIFVRALGSVLFVVLSEQQIE